MGANKFVVSKPKSDSIAPQLKSCPWCALTFGEKPKVVHALASIVLEFFPHTFFSFTLCSSYIGFLSKLATFPSSSGSIYLLLLLLVIFSYPHLNPNPIFLTRLVLTHSPFRPSKPTAGKLTHML